MDFGFRDLGFKGLGFRVKLRLHRGLGKGFGF